MSSVADLANQTRLARRVGAVALLLIIIIAAYLRFEGLGVRSLWWDELCTWHVSRMSLGESLRWGPELTKPPLYQLSLRLLTDDPKPTETMLRLPAAISGWLVVPAVAWLGWMAGGWPVAVASAGLMAFHDLNIYYSQEARPYSMLVLGCTVATALWYCVVAFGKRRYLIAYVLVAALALYAHYLAALTIAAHVLWWLLTARQKRDGRHRAPHLLALMVIALLCVPLVVRYVLYKSSMFQGLEWIKPVTWESFVAALGALGYGWPWTVLATVAVGAWLVGLPWRGSSTPRVAVDRLVVGRKDTVGLLAIWMCSALGGLIVISWLARPALVSRYALPASVPLLLIPLVVLHRLHRWLPLVVMGAFVAGAAPQWVIRDHDPGLRELTVFLQERVDPEKELVVLTLDPTIYPGWEDSERLTFDYYPLEGIAVRELRLAPDGITALNDVLQDPRGMYLVVLWADPFAVLEAAERTPLPIEHEGRSYSQLLFTPYRLVRVAPLR